MNIGPLYIEYSWDFAWWWRKFRRRLLWWKKPTIRQGLTNSSFVAILDEMYAKSLIAMQRDFDREIWMDGKGVYDAVQTEAETKTEIMPKVP